MPGLVPVFRTEDVPCQGEPVSTCPFLGFPTVAQACLLPETFSLVPLLRVPSSDLLLQLQPGKPSSQSTSDEPLSNKEAPASFTEPG